MNNYSKQRDAILETLKEMHTHPTSEELYEKVNKKYTLQLAKVQYTEILISW